MDANDDEPFGFEQCCACKAGRILDQDGGGCVVQTCSNTDGAGTNFDCDNAPNGAVETFNAANMYASPPTRVTDDREPGIRW